MTTLIPERATQVSPGLRVGRDRHNRVVLSTLHGTTIVTDPTRLVAAVADMHRYTHRLTDPTDPMLTELAPYLDQAPVHRVTAGEHIVCHLTARDGTPSHVVFVDHGNRTLDLSAWQQGTFTPDLADQLGDALKQWAARNRGT